MASDKDESEHWSRTCQLVRERTLRDEFQRQAAAIWPRPPMLGIFPRAPWDEDDSNEVGVEKETKTYNGRITKVVNEDMLEQFTRQGWYLVHVLQGSDVVQAHGQAPRATQAPNGYYSNDTVATVTPVPVVTHKFLLALDEESSLAQLTKELESFKDQLSEVKASEHNALVDRTRLETEAASVRRDLEYEKRRAEQSQKQYNEQLARNRKFENDIAAIRTAIGTERMNEILGAK